MIERWNSFRKQSPFFAGCVLGGAIVLLGVLILLALTSAKGKFGSAETILVEDYARLAVNEFGQSGDIGRARWRYEKLGSDGSAFLALLRNDPLTDPVKLLNFARAVGDDVLIRAAEAAPEVKSGGSSALLGFFLVLLIIALLAAGIFFVLTAPALEKWTKPIRASLNPILEKAGFKGKGFATKGGTGDPAINYRQPSFQLNDVDERSQSETVNPGSRSAAPAPVVKPETVKTDEPALIQPSVDQSRPAGRASAEFFEEVKSQGVKPVDEATKQVAFTPEDMPDFLKPIGSSKPDPVVEALIEAITGEDVPVDGDENGSRPEPDMASVREGEAGRASDGIADDRETPPANQRPETDIPADHPVESYSVYEAPRRAVWSQEPVSLIETLESEDDEPWDGTSDEINPVPDDMGMGLDKVGETDDPAPWDETAEDFADSGDSELVADEDADLRDDGWSDTDEGPPAPWDEASVEAQFAEISDEDEDSWMPRVVDGTVQKRTIEVNPDLSLPLIQYQAIYQLGDDFFDETFSIDEIDDEFIGECGIGIAETINTTEPKAVTAFEAWLFDRQDTVTPTVFLLSDYAYRQPEMLERLKNKGQFELMQVGKKVEIETYALKMTLTISEIIYGSESSDPKSYFDKVVFDVKVTRKETK